MENSNFSKSDALSELDCARRAVESGIRFQDPGEQPRLFRDFCTLGDLLTDAQKAFNDVCYDGVVPRITVTPR